MPSNYAAIRDEHRDYYGKGIGEYGPRLLTDLYNDRTHFIFEILQNAEDALARLKGPAASRRVTFDIQDDALWIRHYGDPFTAEDVRNICRIADSNKEMTAIGKFGIGFKSVYAYTDRPEIHSGEDHFAIEDLVIPTAVHPIQKDPQETVIILPFNKNILPASIARSEITNKLANLDMETLLFLRNITEIRWNLNGRSGQYWKDIQDWGPHVRKVRLYATDEPGQEWIIFSRPVFRQKKSMGSVQIAFLFDTDDENGLHSIYPNEESPLFAFFKTVVPTNFDFLIHGPYRTTPSRDNIPPNDRWNTELIQETSFLVRDSILWLRDQNLLTAETLEGVAKNFNPPRWRRNPSMFDPISKVVENTVQNDQVLPKQGGGYVSVESGKIGTGEVREFLTPSALTEIFSSGIEQSWISEDIGQQRTPRLYDFLTDACSLPRIDPSWLLRNLTRDFLEQRTDEWIQSLYAFFRDRRLAKVDLESAPLIRLENGRHVQAVGADGRPSAYLPGEQPTGFPTVRMTICASEDAVAFLMSLGIHEVDQIDDVLQHIIPKYQNGLDVPNDDKYAEDIRRIVSAFTTAQRKRKDEFISELQKIPFVRAIDSVEQSPQMVQPSSAYWPTDDIMTLFSGVPGILFIDTDSIDLEIRQSLESVLSACGAMSQLTPLSFFNNISHNERRELRITAGQERISMTRTENITDWRIPDLQIAIDSLTTLSMDSLPKKSESLWNLLISLWSKDSNVFRGEYTWHFHGLHSADFDASFIKILKATPWIANNEGKLVRPDEVVFEDLGWTPHSDLQKQIGFRPAVMAALAAQAGIDIGILELLKSRGITTKEELERILPQLNPAPQPRTPPSTDGAPRRERRAYGQVPGKAAAAEGTEGRTRSSSGSQRPPSPGRPRTQTEGFISYVAVHPDDHDPEPSGAERKRRLDLERMAIELIQRDDPEWIVAPPNTAGYDLYTLNENGEATEWCEVKALSGSLDDTPVRMSHTQFTFAQEKQDACWLYVVEYAGDAEQARMLKIQNPAGLARTFTFDRGWRDVALKDQAQPGGRDAP